MIFLKNQILEVGKWILFKPREVRVSTFWVLLATAVLVALFFIISQLGFLAGSMKHMKEQTASLSESVDKLERYASLMEENLALKTALRKSEEQCQRAEKGLSIAAFGLGFISSLAKKWEDRNAAREIIIHGFLKKFPLRLPCVYRINFQKKALVNGDIVRCAKNLTRADFDDNGYIFPHLLEKMPMGIFVQLPGETRAFIYDFKRNMMGCAESALAIPQQNFLLIK